MEFSRQEYWNGVTVWLSFIESVKAVVHVIRLASFLWLWFQCLPSDASSQCLLSYLGFSYLGCGVSLHGCSSKAQPLLLTSDVGYLLTAATPDLGHGVSWYVAFYLASFIYQVFKIHHILIQQRSHLGSNHTPGTQVARLVPITLKKKLLICSLTWWYISQFTCFCHFDKKFWNFEFIHLNIQTIYRDRTNLAFLKAPP